MKWIYKQKHNIQRDISLSISNIIIQIMEKYKEEDKILLPHHVQQQLCDTRLSYRQGRNLTAVKVYSIAKESNHLLVFGVPSLNLRQETKALFMKFGKLLQFNISKDYASEPFTETYHAQYQLIQSARIAKRKVDTGNFYGGSLHVCYAPELETINETHKKILQRENDVLLRLKNIEKEENKFTEEQVSKNVNISAGEQGSNKNLLNMGEVNIIMTGNDVKRSKRKINSDSTVEKRFKPCFVNESSNNTALDTTVVSNNEKLVSSNVTKSLTDITEVEIVDCTSVDNTTVSNINEALNYNKFGNEVVLRLPIKPVNKIKFNVNKKSLVYIMFYFNTFINIFIHRYCH